MEVGGKLALRPAPAIRELGLQDARGARSHEGADASGADLCGYARDLVGEAVLHEAQLGGTVVAAIEARERPWDRLLVEPHDLAGEGVERDGLEAAWREPGGARPKRRARGLEAAVVGGVDTFCLTTLYGFNSLQLLSNEPCRPWDAARQGISIGEGAAFILLQRSEGGDGTMHLLGAGESCDAHHMSAPHPEGLGARLAMQAALDAAGLEAAAIDYVNLHGTGTPSNDASEDQAVVGLFGEHVPASSTKGMTGHTLGAAGAIEALITVLALEEGRIPGSPGTRILDPKLRARYAIRGREAPLARALSNSFGFGGSNCSLVFGRA